jgi:ArsR family transcriptional regulator
MKTLAVIEQECCPPVLTPDMTDADADLAARVFKALGDPARVKLLSALAGAAAEGCCVCDLIPSTGLSQPTVSHHLKILKNAGLLQREKRGTWAYYRIDRKALAAVRRALR